LKHQRAKESQTGNAASQETWPTPAKNHNVSWRFTGQTTQLSSASYHSIFQSFHWNGTLSRVWSDAEPHAVTQGFVLFRMDKNIIYLYLVMHEKNTDWYRCICTTSWLEPINQKISWILLTYQYQLPSVSSNEHFSAKLVLCDF